MVAWLGRVAMAFMALNKKKSNEGKAIAEKNKFDAENPFKEFCKYKSLQA
jgi:hypothetical protein